MFLEFALGGQKELTKDIGYYQDQLAAFQKELIG
jgi:hypothetical protein